MYEAEIIRRDGTSVRIPMHAEEGAGCVLLTLPRACVPEDFASIRLMPELLDARAGQDGYYVLPHNPGYFLTRFRPREDCSLRWPAALLPLVGMVRDGRAQMLVFRGMKDAMEIEASVCGGEYRCVPLLRWEETELYEDVSLELHTLTGADADYSGMARRYRQGQLRRGLCRPLREKAEERPILWELAKSPEIRIRMGWKPVPTPVLEQTHETEPPMRTACTFAQAEALVREMRRQGIPNAELCLVGWNVKGHDGRYPEIFPPEQALGGEEGLRRLIRTAQDAGYQIVGHTNSTDAYSISEDWNPDDILRRRDGSMRTTASWSGGRMYELRPDPALTFAKRDLPRAAALGFRGAHYIDVISTVGPRPDFDPRHPLNQRECADKWNGILAYASEQFGAIASEGVFDFTAGVLDYGLYAAFHTLSDLPPLADEPVPLPQLVYHGIVMNNPSAETVNYPVKAPENRLRFYEYGGRPAIYYYSRFRTDGANWMGADDFTMDTPAELTRSVGLIGDVCREYLPLAGLQFEFMERHERAAESVFRTEYADGTRMLFNYSAEPVEVNGIRAAPLDFTVVRA